jgi:hypothetical protein
VLTCDDDQARRINLGDNKLAELGGYDEDDLAALLAGLDGDYDGTGWTQDDYDALLREEPQARTDPDDVPPVPDEPVTRPGDLWQLGPHRLLCGDAQEPGDLGKLLGGNRPDAILTDPPYGMNLDTRYSRAPKGSARCALKGREPAMKDFRPVIGDDEPFDAGFLAAHFAVVPEQFWFGADYYRRTLSEQDADGSWLVWDKRNEDTDAVIGSGFELIWSKQPHKRDMLRVYWNGAFGDKEARGRAHPTQKPTRLLAEIIERWIKPGSMILDLFAGSGSTLIAAHSLGRPCCVMEMDPAYCDVICQRYQEHTGIAPERIQ